MPGNKTVCMIILALLLFSLRVSWSDFQPARLVSASKNWSVPGIDGLTAQVNETEVSSSVVDLQSARVFQVTERIRITPDGEVEPSSAPIRRNGDAYLLTGNISGRLVDGIIIQKSNVVLDGAGFEITTTDTLARCGIEITDVDNVTVRNISIRSFHDGIFLSNSSLCRLEANSIEASSGDGIHFYKSDCGTVIANNATDNANAGIYMELSKNNSILRNTLSFNKVGAVYLKDGCLYNRIACNDLFNNTRYGLYVYNSMSNIVFHNNFVNNTYHAVCIESSDNPFDDGYPSAGNHWNGYVGVDLFGGPFQNVSGSDGVGDTPYAVDGSQKDNYPLVEAYWFLGDINHDLTVNMTDANSLAEAFGTIPGEALWNQSADITGPNRTPDGKVDMRDISLFARHLKDYASGT